MLAASIAAALRNIGKAKASQPCNRTSLKCRILRGLPVHVGSPSCRLPCFVAEQRVHKVSLDFFFRPNRLDWTLDLAAQHDGEPNGRTSDEDADGWRVRYQARGQHPEIGYFAVAVAAEKLRQTSRADKPFHSYTYGL